MDAAEVVDGARGLDASFSPRRHPHRVAYQFLTRYQRELAGKMIQREREALSRPLEIPLPLADFAAGAPLESAPGVALQWDALHDVSRVDAAGEAWPVWIVPYVQRYEPDRWPFGWIRDTTLFLGGRANDWNGFSKIVVEHTPTPGTISAPADELILPDSALNVVVLALGADFYMRRPKEASRSTLPAEWQAAEVAFLDLIEERNARVEVGKVRRVFS